MLYNHTADRALALRFNRQELPCFTVWKNTAALEDGYVTGLEPATNFPNFKSFERSQTLLMPSDYGTKLSTEQLNDVASFLLRLAQSSTPPSVHHPEEE